MQHPGRAGRPGGSLRADPVLREEVETARLYRIPRSLLMGRVAAPGEPLWLPLDASLAISLERLRAAETAERCGQCGTVPDDWLDADGFPSTSPAYEVVVVECEGCRRLAMTRAELTGAHHAGKSLSFRRLTADDFDPALTDTARAAASGGVAPS